MKPVIDGCCTGTLNDLMDILLAPISQTNDAFLIQTTGDHRAVDENPNMGRQTVTKPMITSNGLVGVRPLEPAVKMQGHSAF